MISGNLHGVRLTGSGAHDNLITDSFIGTDITGLADLGNARDGVRIEAGAHDNRVIGTAAGLLVISGNNRGLTIVEESERNTVRGALIGTDPTGLHFLGNSEEGLLIDASPDNQIGGALPGQGNAIIANHWGVVIQGATAIRNKVEGNTIGHSEREGVLGHGRRLRQHHWRP